MSSIPPNKVPVVIDNELLNTIVIMLLYPFPSTCDTSHIVRVCVTQYTLDTVNSIKKPQFSNFNFSK